MVRRIYVNPLTCRNNNNFPAHAYNTSYKGKLAAGNRVNKANRLILATNPVRCVGILLFYLAATTLLAKCEFVSTLKHLLIKLFHPFIISCGFYTGKGCTKVLVYLLQPGSLLRLFRSQGLSFGQFLSVFDKLGHCPRVWH